MRVVVIPARYGSSRFPGKPLVNICGKPMIQWVYEGVVGSCADVVLVATDDVRIKECAEGFGARVVMTDPDCPSGTDRVYQAVKGMEGVSYVVNVQGDEPLIESYVVDAIFDELERTDEAIVTPVVETVDVEEVRDPNVVKVVLDSRDFALYFSRSVIPFYRDKEGVYYKHIGIYGFKIDVLRRFVGLSGAPIEIAEGLEQLRALYFGIPVKVVKVDYESVGVDVPEDVAKVESLIKRRK